MEHIISIKNLRKSFGEIKAVNDISFDVAEGELFAFLGVNGAGKSTTISILCGQLAKDGGEVSICGLDHSSHGHEIKQSIGVVFQSSLLDKALTVKDNLASRAALYGIHGEEFEKRLSYLSKLLDFSDILSLAIDVDSQEFDRKYYFIINIYYCIKSTAWFLTST